MDGRETHTRMYGTVRYRRMGWDDCHPSRARYSLKFGQAGWLSHPQTSLSGVLSPSSATRGTRHADGSISRTQIVGYLDTYVITSSSSYTSRGMKNETVFCLSARDGSGRTVGPLGSRQGMSGQEQGVGQWTLGWCTTGARRGISEIRALRPCRFPDTARCANKVDVRVLSFESRSRVVAPHLRR
ncbi:hypothetical protein BDW22DRAFT_141834 [Trametopsis cervina]|nr:hypothetical protein BDW22DRAFT_141834 [Trametopsis cervina]